MSKFICTKTDCANNGVEYDFGDDHPVVAECGGCHTKLLPIKDETNG